MSFGDWSWLSNMFSSTPSFVQPGQDPSTWQPQPQFMQQQPQPQPQPIQQHSPMMSPEMGGGAARQAGMDVVDALGSSGRNVNAASTVAAGGQPGMGEAVGDFFGAGAPGGFFGSNGGKLALTGALLAGGALMARRSRGAPMTYPAMPNPMLLGAWRRRPLLGGDEEWPGQP